jgi:large exoprotein involved in heme utilization and adhesion
MLSQLRTATLAAFLAALGALTSGTAAHANIVFDFSGLCADGCSGTATGVLTLTGAYMFGTDITSATFVSFSYASSDLIFTVPAATAPAFEGGLNADGSFDSTGDLIIQNEADGFSPVGGEFDAGLPNAPKDLGFQFQFSPVPAPEPGTWTLMTIGFAALGLVGYRRTITRPLPSLG